MKICWDNIEDLRLTCKGNFKNSKRTLFVYGGKCAECGCEFLMSKKKPTVFCSESCASIGKKLSKSTKQKISNTLKGRKFSDTHKARLGAASSRRFEDRTNCTMYGKKHSKEARKKMSEALTGRTLSVAHRKKISAMKKELFKDPTNNPMYGKHHSSATKAKISKSNTGKRHSEETKQKMSRDRMGNPPTNYKGVTETGFATYDTYADRLSVFEEVRVSPDNSNFLEVRCTSCRKWHIPLWSIVRNRLAAFNGTMPGEHRFYCSEECKSACSIYGTRKFPKDFNNKRPSRSVNPIVINMCFERDGWVCQICGKSKYEAKLHCHHIEGYTQNPLMGNDIDNLITLCKECHNNVHRLPGCKQNDLKCEE